MLKSTVQKLNKQKVRVYKQYIKRIDSLITTIENHNEQFNYATEALRTHLVAARIQARAIIRLLQEEV